MRARALPCIAAVLLGAAPAAAAAQEPGSPEQVEVGVWFNDVHTVDLIDGSFGAELYLWWVSRDEAFEPFEVLQILNGRDWTVRAVNRRTLPDGRTHTSGYLSVTINHGWDLLYYPFDRQKLRLIIETPFPSSEVRLVPDHDGSLVGGFASVGGYHVTGFGLSEHVERYETDFGYRDGAAHSFSRLVIELELRRDSRRVVVVMFVGFLVANLVALLTYAVHVSNLGIRTSMSAGAIFGAVGNMYFLHGEVHPAAGSILIDGVALVTFGGIVVALLTGIIVDRLYRWKGLLPARIFNWTAFALVFVGTLTYLGLAFRAAM